MSILPPMPPWNGLHVVVVHLPIGLLTVVPVLVGMAMLTKKSGRAFGAAALIILALGTGAAFLAVMTGEAAAEIADGAAGTTRVMEEHEELGELTRNLFLGLTLIYAALVGAAALLKGRMGRRWWVIANGVILLLSLGALIPLANTGHLGGRLVHEFGVRAPLTPMGGGFEGEDVEE